MPQLREHQIDIVQKIHDGFNQGHRCQLLWGVTGLGKTEISIYLMKQFADEYKTSAMVMDRIVLVDQTSMRLTKYGIDHGVMQADHWRYKPHERIQVCSVQTLARRSRKWKPDLLIIDECFVAGTKISTPSGYKDIDKVSCGDVVLTQAGYGVVEAVSAKCSEDLYHLEFDDGTKITCTGNHPFFTQDGWKIARELERGENFFSEEGVRLLWEYVQSLDKNGSEWEDNLGAKLEGLEQARMLLNILCEEIKEPNEQSSGSVKNESEAKRNKAQAYPSRRERALASFASFGSSSRFRGGLGGGVRCADQNTKGKWLSNLLQNRHSKSIDDDGDRSGWVQSHDDRKEGSGSEKNRISCFPRLVGISRVESESPRTVYNLQVSGHPSYFANGKLVHNCHVLHKSTIKMIEDNPDMKVIGLTATPFTKGLGKIFSNIVAGPTYEKIIENEWLVPVKVFVAKEIDMQGAKKVAGEWSPDDVTERGIKITGDIVAEWEKKTIEIFKKPVKTVVFSAGVAHGKDLERKFKEAGYNFVSISYKNDDDFKRIAIEEFSKPDSEIHGLIATDILTRGFDVPDVMIGISARPFSKSFSSHVQQIGRVMRPHPTKSFAVWLDHSGNFLRFRKDWDSLFTDGVTELKEGGEKAKKEPTEKEKRESKCPICSALWVWKGDECEECGHVRKRMSSVVNVAGTLEALDFKPKPFNTQDFYSELIYYARIKGYKEGWAAHKYKERTGAFPRGLEKKPKPISMETSNWIRSRMIAYAKSNNRRAFG